jgi:hypothetical protein
VRPVEARLLTGDLADHGWSHVMCAAQRDGAAPACVLFVARECAALAPAMLFDACLAAHARPHARASGCAPSWARRPHAAALPMSTHTTQEQGAAWPPALRGVHAPHARRHDRVPLPDHCARHDRAGGMVVGVQHAAASCSAPAVPPLPALQTSAQPVVCGSRIAHPRCTDPNTPPHPTPPHPTPLPQLHTHTRRCRSSCWMTQPAAGGTPCCAPRTCWRPAGTWPTPASSLWCGCVGARAVLCWAAWAGAARGVAGGVTACCRVHCLCVPAPLQLARRGGTRLCRHPVCAPPRCVCAPITPTHHTTPHQTPQHPPPTHTHTHHHHHIHAHPAASPWAL